MPTYIQLINWTDQGIRNVKDSPERLDLAREMVRESGGTLGDFYLTMGPYDMVALSEAEDDAAVARATLRLGAAGSIRSVTMRAFTEAEYRKIIASL